MRLPSLLLSKLFSSISATSSIFYFLGIFQIRFFSNENMPGSVFPLAIVYTKTINKANTRRPSPRLPSLMLFLATGHEAALSSPSSPADHIIRVPHSSRSDEDVGANGMEMGWDEEEDGRRMGWDGWKGAAISGRGRILKGATYASFDLDAVGFFAFCLCNNKFYI